MQRDGELVATLSTDAKVRVWDGLFEVLEHSARAVDLSRATRGLPILRNHERDEVIGRAERLRLDGGRLRASLRFGHSEAARSAEADVAAGILTDLSIGYTVDEFHTVPGDRPGGSVRMVTRWTPLEVSMVAIPADPNAGIGRSLPTTPKARMPESSTIEAPATAPNQPTRAEQILSMCEAAGVSAAEARAFIGSERSIPEIGGELVKRVAQQHGRSGRVPALESQYGPRVGLVDLLRAQHPEFRGDHGPVREYTQEIERNGFRAQNGGLPFPMFGTRSTLSTAIATKGPEAVFSEYAGTLDLLRPESRWEALGVQVHYGTQNNVRYVEQTGGATTSWVAEGPGAGVAATSATISNRNASPKFLQAMTLVTKNFLTQSVDAELAERDLRAATAAEIERALFWGSGAANQPTGIGVASGTNVVAIGANGGQMTLPKLVESLSALAAAQADVSRLRFLATPQVGFSMANTPRFTNTDSRTLWDLDENAALGRPAFMSTNLPTALTKGTANNCHGAIMGDFSAAHLFFFGPGVEVTVDPFTLADRNLVRIIVYVAVDVLLTRPAFFAVYRDLLP